MGQLGVRFRVNKLVVWIFLLVLIFFHIFLILNTFVLDSSGNMRSSYAGFGDIPFHMTQVSKFAFEKTINFNEPIFDGERMRYAFFINLFSGLILRSTSNWFLAMQIPVVIFMTGGTIIMFILYKNFLKSHLLAFLAVIIFLFGSGFGANAYIKNDILEANYSIGEFVQHLVSSNASTIIKWDAKFPDQNIVWGAPLSLVFLHQRAFMLGFFMFTLFLYFFVKWRKNQTSLKLILICGAIVGFSPLAHYHSYVAMLVVISIFGVMAVIEKNKLTILRLLFLGFIILVFSIPQLIYLLQGKNAVFFAQQAFVKFRLGWMTEPATGLSIFDPSNPGILPGVILPYLHFIWLNFGFILPAFFISLFIVLKLNSIRKYFPDILTWTIAGFILFALVQLVRFQPWDFDDNKILVYFQFFAAPVTVAVLVWIFRKWNVLKYFVLSIFIIIATYSGFIDEIPRLLSPIESLPVIFNVDSQKMAEFIKNNLAQQDRIITSTTHLNLVSSLAGRPVIVGYPGWLWTRGISYNNRESDLRKFYNDPEQNKYIAGKYNAKYVLLDPAGVSDWHINKSIFDNEFNLLYKSGQYSLYQIN